METTTTLVSSIELEQLVYSIAKHTPRICMRYRILGGLWHPNFLEVMMNVRAGGAVVFHDARRQKDILLPDLSNVTQFELDGRFGNLEPNYHYQVV